MCFLCHFLKINIGCSVANLNDIIFEPETSVYSVDIFVGKSLGFLGLSWISSYTSTLIFCQLMLSFSRRGSLIYVNPWMSSLFFLGHLDVGASVAGDFHLAADVALMETLSRALATGGRRVLRGLVKINSFGRHLKDQRNF